MKAFLSHFTALAYWRDYFPHDSLLGAPAETSRVEECAYRKADLIECVPDALVVPGRAIDVLVFHQNCRSSSRDIDYHVWRTPLPDDAFYQDGRFYVSSPEFTFLQLSSSLSIAQLIALGCELCGTYVLQPGSPRNIASLHGIGTRYSPDRYPKRPEPLTTIERLIACVESARGARGGAKARRALRYVVEASRSVMETETALKLCLPPMIGGYGIPFPAMNETIDLDDEGRAIAGSRWCNGDLCWNKAKLDVEYYGDVHAEFAQMQHDAGRVLGIEHMKWQVIILTYSQVSDITRFEVVAHEVADRVDHRLRKPILGRTSARATLFAELEEWRN